MPSETIQPKKMMIILILRILQQYSDENHPLSIKRIQEILFDEYNMKTDRKAVSRNIHDLAEFYDIEYTEKTRNTPVLKNGKPTGEITENTVMSDFYLLRDFDESELRLLIDSILFSKHIPSNQCNKLVEKISSLGGKHYENKMKYVSNLPQKLPENKEVFYSISCIDEAIQKEKKVTFNYNSYDTDKKLHPREDEDGNIKLYSFSPFQMVATNGRYYLIGTFDGKSNLSNLRIDRITNISVSDDYAIAKSKIKEIKNGKLNLPEHMAEHIYMFHGESVFVKFKANRYLCNDILDWFGSDARFGEITDDSMVVTVKTNKKAMKYWALQFADHITILSPKDLREDVKKSLVEALERYN